MAVERLDSAGLQPFIIRDVRPTGRKIGAGSYGTIEEVELPRHGIRVAAKKLHEVLVGAGTTQEVDLYKYV